jgi:hypothetical protein
MRTLNWIGKDAAINHYNLQDGDEHFRKGERKQ